MPGAKRSSALGPVGRMVLKTVASLGGPPTALFAAAGEEVLAAVATDLDSRQLSLAERLRLEAALPNAIEEAQRRLDQGETINESFKTRMKTGRMTGEAVLEAGFLAAARTH